MAITVVNIRNAKYDIYIGRSGKGVQSKWGNPFKNGSREENIANFEKYLLANTELMQALPELLNKRLGCFCAPRACHGDILKKYAEITGE